MANSPIPITLTPNTTQGPNPPPSWAIYSVIINNQSNCWLKDAISGQYIAGPWQQAVYSYPAGTSSPSFTLTSTAPAGLVDQPIPTGTCYLTLTDISLQPNPGVVQANLSTIANELPIGAFPVPKGTTRSLSVAVPAWANAIAVLASWSSGAAGRVTVTGDVTGLNYVLNYTINNSTGIGYVLVPVVSSEDTTVTVTFVNQSVLIDATVRVVAMPGGALDAILLNVYDGSTLALRIESAEQPTTDSIGINGQVASANMVFNGSAWDRWRGTTHDGGVPVPWVDRSNQFVGFGTAPHASTTRFTYTVPAGKVAVVESMTIMCVRDGTTATPARAQGQVVYAPNGGTAVSYGIKQVWTGAIGDGQNGSPDHPPKLTMQAGDALNALTLDLSTGGTMTFLINCTIREYTPPF